MERSWARIALGATVAMTLAACGGGGGGGAVTDPTNILGTTQTFGEKGVFTGILASFNFDFQAAGGDSGLGGGADGDGGIGAGGALGQFRNARVVVRFLDGTPLGEALTDPVYGMVTIKPGRDYRGGLLVEIHGRDGAFYFEEGKNALVPFPAGQVIRSIIPRIDKNIGVTPFTEAAYLLAVECLTTAVPGVCDTVTDPGAATADASREVKAAGIPSTQAITRANAHVTAILNQQFPAALHVDDVTRLPFIVGDATAAGSVPASSQRGRYGLVNIAFSKQAAMYNTADAAPTLLAIRQLGSDLRDGVLDGLAAGNAAAPAGQRTYDPQTIATELSSALAQQTSRYGNTDARSVLPRLVGFGAARYDSYFFEARVAPDGAASTIAMATEAVTPTRTPGQATPYLPGADRRAFTVFGNTGSGSLFIKTDSADSTSQILAVGDNTNGELGSGNRTGTSRNTPTYTLTFPGVVTHIAGGFGHTLARLADGRVFAWGDNAYGQLGQGSVGGALPRALTPVAVPLPAGALSVAAGNTSSFALLEDGRVFAWGSAWGFGTLGSGAKDTVRPTPGPVLTETGPLTGVVQMSVRENDGIALRSDGSVWTWGSFPGTSSDPGPDFVPVSNAGGHPFATRITGLPATGRVRKVITDQGLFAALMSDGAVFTWGIYHDITAGRVLVDLEPVRVLNLPPLRDMMTGAFQPYGQRPFDRDTALGVDYEGLFWRVRGRVAERYDPADPLAQRRPRAQEPRPDCSSCHTVRGPTVPAMPTTGAVCDVATIPTKIRELLTSQSQCESCHNGAPLANQPALPILACVKPPLPAPPPPTQPVALPTVCSLPATGHVGFPAGTTCASCHNSVIAPPLKCATAPGTFATPLPLTTVIARIVDDLGREVAPGGAIGDASPGLRGTISGPLAAGQAVQVLRDTALAGTATVTGNTWSFDDSGLTGGTFRYTARVAAAGNATFGTLSAGFPVTVDLTSPNQSVSLSSVTDNVGSGAFAGTFTTSPITTDDTTPTLAGTIASPLAAGERLVVLRNDQVVGTATVNGSAWTFTDTLTTNGTNVYRVRVLDAANNGGVPSNAFTVNLLAGPPASVNIVQVLVPQSVPSGSTTSNARPDLRLSFSRALLAGERLEFTRRRTGDANATALVVPSVTAGSTSAAFVDTLPSDGTFTYSARMVNDAGNAQQTPFTFVLTCSGCITLNRAVQGLTVSSDVLPVLGDLGSGATTADTRPTIRGTVSGGAPFTGLSVVVTRSGGGGANVEQTASLNTTTGAWTLTEPSALASGAYQYTARVQASATNRGAESAPFALNVSVLPTFATGSMTTYVDNRPSSGGTAVVTRSSGTETDDNTPTLSGTLSAALTGGQTLRFFSVENGVEVPLAGTPSFGTATTFTFTPTTPLANTSVFNSSESESTRLTRIRTFTLRAVITDAVPNRRASVDLSLLLQPLCGYVQGSPSSHSAAAPTCTSCHTSGGSGSGTGPGFTCRNPQLAQP